jgi:hypothetical protein
MLYGVTEEMAALSGLIIASASDGKKSGKIRKPRKAAANYSS